MSILIAIAAICIIIVTLPLLRIILAPLGNLLGNILGFIFGIGVLLGLIYFFFFVLDFKDYLDFGSNLLEIFLYIGLPLISLFLLKHYWNVIKARKDEKKRQQEKIDLKIEKEEIDIQINKFISDCDTDSMYSSKSGKKYGGKLNDGGWNFDDILKFIAKNKLSIKHLSLEKIDPILVEDFDIKKSNQEKIKFSEEIGIIADETELNNAKNKCNASIQNINNYRNYCIKYKKWIIDNLENILVKNAKLGNRLPFKLDANNCEIDEEEYSSDHPLSEMIKFDFKNDFEALRIEINDDKYLIKQDPNEYLYANHYGRKKSLNYFKVQQSLFKLISSSKKFDKHFTDLGLTYSFIKPYDISKPPSKIILEIDNNKFLN